MLNGYLLMIALIVGVAPFIKRRDKSLGYVIYACAILIIWMGLRDITSIGVDSRVNYSKQFVSICSQSINQILFDDYTNIGLKLMMKFVGSVLHLNYQGFVFLEALFAYVIFGRMIYKYSPSPMQSIICHCGLLYFFLFMDAMKQCMAMAFLCLAFDGIVEKKPIKFLIFVIAGSFFHLPAIIFIPAYIIANHNNIKFYFVELFLTFSLVYVFRRQLLDAMVEFYGAPTSGSGVFLTNKTIIMIVVIIVAFMFRIPKEDDRVYKILLQIMGIATVLQTFSGFSNNFERLADYYFQFSVLFIPMVFENKNLKGIFIHNEGLYKVRLVIVLFSCLFFVYRFISIASGAYYYTPYRFFWQ